jgi:hypothetical protein
MYILMYFCQKSGCGTTLTIPPLGFTAITDHPRAGEVLPGCGPQSHVAPVSIPVRIQSRTTAIVGVAGSQSGPLSCLSKWTAGAALIWGRYQN